MRKRRASAVAEVKRTASAAADGVRHFAFASLSADSETPPPFSTEAIVEVRSDSSSSEEESSASARSPKSWDGDEKQPPPRFMRRCLVWIHPARAAWASGLCGACESGCGCRCCMPGERRPLLQVHDIPDEETAVRCRCGSCGLIDQASLEDVDSAQPAGA